MPDPAEPQAQPADGEPPAMTNAPLPKGVSREMLLGIAVGLIFAGISIAAPMAADVPKSMLDVFLATGVAIILTAFGGQATIAVKSAIFAGTTATMLAILWFLGQEGDVLRLARGQITNFDWREYEAKLKFADYSESYFDSVSKQYRFVAFENNMTTAEAVVVFTPKTGFDQERPQIKIPVDCFMTALGRGKTEIDWRYDEAQHAIVDTRRGGLVIGTELRAPDPNPCIKAKATAALFGKEPPSGIRPQQTPPKPLDPVVRGGALKDLESADPDLRRIARDILASGAPEDVRSYLDHLGGNNSYLAKLGISVALTEMLRQDKGRAEAISSNLFPADFERLTGFIGEGDRTLRIYAAEFLFDLSDPRGTQFALRRAAEFSNDDNAVFDWLFCGQGGWLKMKSEEKAPLRRLLDQIRRQSANKPKISLMLAKYNN